MSATLIINWEIVFSPSHLSICWLMTNGVEVKEFVHNLARLLAPIPITEQIKQAQFRDGLPEDQVHQLAQALQLKGAAICAQEESRGCLDPVHKLLHIVGMETMGQDSRYFMSLD